MPTSSPYSNNDYSVFQTRPYNLPINQIAGAFQAKNNAWNQGAERIKSRYDAIAQMDLSKEENINIRNEYIKKSQEDLQKLSASDLSDPNVQKAGTQLFDNILKDKAILYDNAATKHKQKIDADAEKARKTENGKYYNDANYQYALDGYDEFLKAPNRDAGAQYLQKAKEYTPYYNFNEEMLKLKKECGGASTSGQSPVKGTLYAKQTEESGSDPATLEQCLQSLSSQALKQINIDGYSKFGKNYNALGQSYMQSFEKNVKDYSDKYGIYKGKFDALSHKSTLTEDEKNDLNTNKAYMDFYEGKKANMSDVIQKYNLGDVSYFQNNYEQLAGDFHKNQIFDSFSNSFRTDKHVNKYISDPSSIVAFNWTNRVAEQKRDQNFTERMSGIEYLQAKDLAQFQSGLKIKEELIKGAASANGKSNSDYFYNSKTGEVEFKQPKNTSPNSTDENIESAGAYTDFESGKTQTQNQILNSFKNLQSDLKRNFGVKTSGVLEGKGGIGFTSGGIQDYNNDKTIDAYDFSQWLSGYKEQIEKDLKIGKKPDAKQQAVLDKINDWTRENHFLVETLLDKTSTEKKILKDLDPQVKVAKQEFVNNINKGVVIKLKDKVKVGQKSWWEGGGLNPNYDPNNYEEKITDLKLTPNDVKSLITGSHPLYKLKYVRRPMTKLESKEGYEQRADSYMPMIEVNGKFYNAGAAFGNNVFSEYGQKVYAPYTSKKDDLFHKQRLLTNGGIAAGSYPNLEKGFTDFSETALGNNRSIEIKQYDGVKGGNAIIQVYKKNIVDEKTGAVSKSETPQTDKQTLADLAVIYGDVQPSKIYKDAFEIKGENVDMQLGLYDDVVNKKLERRIENHLELYGENTPPGKSIFGHNDVSAMQFFTSGGTIISVDIVKGHDGTFSYDLRTSNGSVTKPEYMGTIKDEKTLVSRLKRMGAAQ